MKIYRSRFRGNRGFAGGLRRQGWEDLCDPQQLALVYRHVVRQVPPAQSCGLGQEAKCLVELLQVVQLLGERVAEEGAGAVIEITARELGAQLRDVIGFGGLHAQFRAQQIAGILRSIEGDGAITGGFRFGQAAEAALTRCQVVPKPWVLRRQSHHSLVERVRPLMLAQQHRYVRKGIVRIGRPCLIPQRLRYDRIRLTAVTELQQDSGQHSVRGQAHSLSCYRLASEEQCLLRPAGLHQLVSLNVWGGQMAVSPDHAAHQNILKSTLALFEAPMAKGYDVNRRARNGSRATRRRRPRSGMRPSRR